jgi:AAHS family 4-hydroxybenzoate transporter-like MFS transporter
VGEFPSRVEEIIDRSPVSILQGTVIALSALVTVIDGFDAQMIGFLASPIAESFHADIRSFGPVFSVALFGLMLGGLTMGPAGDRWGRRRTLLITVLMVGIFTFVTGFLHSLSGLVYLRFLTGFGLGGTMPSAMSLIAEYTPARLRPNAICLSAACIPVGSMSAGICASYALPHWGWRAMFFIGGIIPFLLAAAIIPMLPESTRFLALRERNEERVRSIMQRISPAAAQHHRSFICEQLHPSASHVPIAELFRHGRAAVTPLLWTAYFMNLLVLYSVVSWLPALLRAAGFQNSSGVMAITLFGCGGIIGSLIQGIIAKRFTPHRVLAAEFSIFIIFVLTLAHAKLNLTIVAVAAFGIGWAIQGAQAGLNVYSSTIYPTTVRATGIGWGLGMGRIGSIVGPLVAGAGLMAGWTPHQIFSAGAVPAVLAAAAVLFSARLGISQMSDAWSPPNQQ